MSQSKTPAQLDAEITEALAEPQRWSQGRPHPADPMARFNDLNRQGFMRNVYAKKRSSKARVMPAPTIACDGCMNWHPERRHTASPTQRKINLAKMKAMRAAVSGSSL